MKFALLIAAGVLGAATDVVAAECFTYQHECVYRPGEPDRRSLREQLKKPIWAPDPPPPPALIRPKLSQPYYGLPSSDARSVEGVRAEIFGRSAPATVPMPCLHGVPRR